MIKFQRINFPRSFIRLTKQKKFTSTWNTRITEPITVEVRHILFSKKFHSRITNLNSLVSFSIYSSLTIIHPRRSNNLLQGIRVKSGGMEPSLDFSSPPPARNKSAVSCSRRVSACATYYTTYARQATFNSYNTSYFPRLDSVDRLPYRKMGKSVRFLLSEFLSGRCAFLPVEGRRLKSSTTSEPLLHAKSLTVNRAIFSWTTILRRSSPPAMEFLSLSFLSPFQCVERREIDGLPFHFSQDGSIFFSIVQTKNYIYKYV